MGRKGEILPSVSLEEIKENDYNLNIARYIDTTEEEEQMMSRQLYSNSESWKKNEKRPRRRCTGTCRSWDMVGDFVQYKEVCSVRKEKFDPTKQDSRIYIAPEHIEQETGKLISVVPLTLKV